MTFDRLGSAALFLVVAPAAVLYLLVFVWAGGMHYLLTIDGLPGIELVVIPLAASAIVVLHPGVWVINEPGERCSLWLPLLGTTSVCMVMWFFWLGWIPWLAWIALGVVPAAAIATGALRGGLSGLGSGLGPEPVEVAFARAPDEFLEGLIPWRPWICAVVAFALIYPGWGSALLLGVSWAATPFLAVFAYCGMVFFPRLTASFAGGITGPALFAVVGYIFFPSSMENPEGPLADTLVMASNIGATLIVTAALFMIAYSESFRLHPLSYAVWVGAATLCLAVSGTFNGVTPIFSS